MQNLPLAQKNDPASSKVVMFDGSSLNGQATIGCVLLKNGVSVLEVGMPIGKATCNEAEYFAAILGLSIAAALGWHECTLQGDSQLVIKQARGEWQANSPNLCRLRDHLLNIARTHGMYVRFEWIPREKNRAADRLAAQEHLI